MEQIKKIQPRRPTCCYPTPEWATAELLQRLPLERGDVILDPACGRGAIAQGLNHTRHGISVWTNDIDPDRLADFHYDMTLRESWKWIERATGGFDWVISNPPFCSKPLAAPSPRHSHRSLELFLQLGYRYARKGVVFLLDRTLVEPERDRRLGWQNYRHEQFLELRLERIRFADRGRQRLVGCNWYGWRHGHREGFVPQSIWNEA